MTGRAFPPRIASGSVSAAKDWTKAYRSGLGLAIVRDISKLYAGFFTLEASDLGGLKTRLVLPAVPAS